MGSTSPTPTRSSSTTPAQFGLAQLYQLRGRVGRATQQAYAYFLYNRDTQLSETAEKRLRAIFEATELGAGFRIAMKDLEIRGAGNLLGAEQSGFMNEIGFDLYTRLLQEEVARMQGEKVSAPPRPAAVTLELPVAALIPDEYIGDRTLKMSFYQRLANLERPEQAEAMEAEMSDRFGPPSPPVANLLALVRLKTEAAAFGFETISLRDGEFIFKLRRTVAVDRVALIKLYRNDAVVHLGEVRIPRRRFGDEPLAWLNELRALLPVIVSAKTAPQAVAGAGAR